MAVFIYRVIGLMKNSIRKMSGWCVNETYEIQRANLPDGKYLLWRYSVIGKSLLFLKTERKLIFFRHGKSHIAFPLYFGWASRPQFDDLRAKFGKD